MKKFLSISLFVCILFTMASCADNTTGSSDTTTELVTVAPNTAKVVELDNEFLTESGNINFTPSDYRIVDETDDGYVIITLTQSTAKSIYKVTTYENEEEARKFVEDKALSGEITNYRNLNCYDNYVVYNLDLTDETYGKFFKMNRNEILKSFGRDAETTATETEHSH